MPSSTFSSEPTVLLMKDAEFSQALERPVPNLPWLPILAATAFSALLFLAGWEFTMRHLGLRAGDLDDGRGYWVAERRKIDSGRSDSIALIGDSRILLDTDLNVWQNLTGRRPIQLGLMGTNAQPILHDLAIDQHFRGLVVIGTAEFSYFSDDAGSMPVVLDYMKRQSPSQRVGQGVYKWLSQYFAFLDSNYTLLTVIERHNWAERRGVEGPYMDVWKISESFADRQTYSWPRLESDEYLRLHARTVWEDVFTGPIVDTHQVDTVAKSSKTDIDAIRARGGEVVWIRPPSTGHLFTIEDKRYPRRAVWDRLMKETNSFGVYFADYPEMTHLTAPDWSHLNRQSAGIFTAAYVKALQDHLPWLAQHGSGAEDISAASNHLPADSLHAARDGN